MQARLLLQVERMSDEDLDPKEIRPRPSGAGRATRQAAIRWVGLRGRQPHRRKARECVARMW